jgi:ligand-binding SRPBCC domain-containing protein
MAVHSFRKVQCIPASLERVWDFFSDPGNLPAITPPYMRFTILSPGSGGGIYAGQLLEYRLRPLPWLLVYWMTEIIQVNQGVYFVDEQRRGPYRLWHHQHHFRNIAGGIEMTDIVHYEVPLGFMGSWANALFVRKQLEGLFQYRRQRVEEIFGVFTPPGD